MDVNCGTLPSPPTSLCPPYPSMFHHPPSPSDLGFYSAAAAHHSAFPFMAAAAASSVAGSQLNPVVSQPSQMSNTLGKSLFDHQLASGIYLPYVWSWRMEQQIPLSQKVCSSRWVRLDGRLSSSFSFFIFQLIKS